MKNTKDFRFPFSRRLLPSLILLGAFLNGVRGWRYEQSIGPVNPSSGLEYGFVLSDVLAYTNGTALFAASTRQGEAIVVRNGHSYHKWTQHSYRVDQNSSLPILSTSHIELTDKVLFLGVAADDNTMGRIHYFWLNTHGNGLNGTDTGGELDLPRQFQPRYFGRFFAVSRDTVHVAAYFHVMIWPYTKSKGVVCYWTRNGNHYKISSRYVLHKRLAHNEQVAFMKYVGSYVVIGTYTTDACNNTVHVIMSGETTAFTPECPENTILGERASPYDNGSKIAISCLCNQGNVSCVAAVLVYHIKFCEPSTLVKRLDDPFPELNLNFGKSFSLFKDTIVVSAPYYNEEDEEVFESSEDINTTNVSIASNRKRTGNIYLYKNYRLEKTVYMEEPSVKKGFGTSVSVMGDVLVVSAPYEDDGHNKAIGRIYLFSVSQFPPEVIAVILFGFLIASILIVLAVLTYYKLHPTSVTVIQPEFK